MRRVEVAFIYYQYKFTSESEMNLFMMKNNNRGWRFKDPYQIKQNWYLTVHKPFKNYKKGW